MKKLLSASTAKLYHERAKRLMRELDIFYCDHPIDLWYLTGLDLSAGQLLLYKNKGALIVDGRYFQYAKERSPYPVYLQKTDALLALLNSKPWNLADSIGFDGSVQNYDSYAHLLFVAQKCHKALTVVSRASLLQKTRAVKGPEEVRRLKKSASLLWEGFERMLPLLKTGVSEKEIAQTFERFSLEQGDGVSFAPLVAFGENAAYPHHKPGKRRLKKGDIVILDLGIAADHYQSDMTRTLFFGEVDPELRAIYATAKRAYSAAKKASREGVLCKDLAQIVDDIIEKEGFSRYACHALGHGVGLEVHESPRIAANGEHSETALEKNMVITLEPGLYIPGKGGVRYEDTLIVGKTTSRSFYPDTSPELI